MCERCVKIEIQIERFRRIAKMINDEATLGGIDTTIAGLEAQKPTLHPQPERQAQRLAERSTVPAGS